MSEEPKIVCATCGVERPERFFKRKGEPALCRSCHYQRPEVKEREKDYRQRPEVKEREKERKKDYHQRPEVKERYKDYYQRPEVKEREKERKKDYHQRPEVKERYKDYHKDYRQRPEVKERKCAAANANTQQAADTYIKALIRDESKGMLKAPDIPQSIIELKRHALILKRAITEQQDEQHSTADI